MTAPACPRRASRGFTLIEVLISILIFSVGILGAIGMQAKLQQSTTQNGDRARASMLANELASQMWARQTVDTSSDATLATAYAAWQTRVATSTGTGATGLPNGAGSALYNSSKKTSTITITWKAPNAAAAAASSSFSTSVVIP